MVLEDLFLVNILTIRKLSLGGFAMITSVVLSMIFAVTDSFRVAIERVFFFYDGCC